MITYVAHAQGFLVSQAGFLFNFNGAGAPAVNQWDVIFVNSDATIDTPSGFTIATSFVGGQGAYAFVRKAVGGEAATVLITTSIPGGPFNAVLGWFRLTQADGLDAAVNNPNAGTPTSSPPVTSGTLAGSTEIALAYLGGHNITIDPHTPVWADGFTPAVGTSEASQGLGQPGVANFIAVKNGVGVAAVNPAVTWTGDANERTTMLLTFTESAACPTCPDCPDCPPGCGVITGDDPAFGIAVALLDCVYNAVDHTGALEIKRRCIVPGEIAWDECECGQLAIAEDRRFGSRIFPLEEQDRNAECGEPFLVVSLKVSLTRCVPGMDANAKSPSCAALQTAAQQLMRDKRNIRSAVMCCLSDIYDASGSVLMGFELGAQETVGPAGRCAGSELTVLLGFANPCEC